MSCQGITKHHLESAEKNDFFVTLRRLAERHELLPDRMRMAEKIEVPNRVVHFGGFGLVRFQTYKGRPVAVKTARVPVLGEYMTGRERERRQEEIKKIRKVRINGTLRQPLVQSQPYYSSNFTGKSFSGAHYPIRTS